MKFTRRLAGAVLSAALALGVVGMAGPAEAAKKDTSWGQRDTSWGRG